jgi:hypothetical protein
MLLTGAFEIMIDSCDCVMYTAFVGLTFVRNSSELFGKSKNIRSLNFVNLNRVKNIKYIGRNRSL